jgi:hypothetical protein
MPVDVLLGDEGQAGFLATMFCHVGLFPEFNGENSSLLKNPETYTFPAQSPRIIVLRTAAPATSLKSAREH